MHASRVQRKRIFCREWTVRPSVRPSTSKRQSSQLSTESWQWTEGRKTVPRLPLSRDSFMSPIHLSHIFSRAPAATHVNTDFGARVNQCRNIRLRLVRISFMDEIETMDGRARSGAGEGGALADSMQAELKSLTASCRRPLTLHRHGRVCVPRLNNDGSASELIREVILSEQGRRNMSGGGGLHEHVSSSSYRGLATGDNSIFKPRRRPSARSVFCSDALCGILVR